MREREFETGMDEQAKQSAMNKLGEAVLSHSRDNDRSSDYLESVRYERLLHLRKLESIELAEREQALTERRNREHTTHLANIQSLEHHRVGFDKVWNLEPAEAKSISEVLSGLQIEAIKTIVIEVMKDQGIVS